MFLLSNNIKSLGAKANKKRLPSSQRDSFLRSDMKQYSPKADFNSNLSHYWTQDCKVA